MEKPNRKFPLQFVLIWSGQAVSMLTSSVLQMAIVWYLTKKTGSAAILSLATLAGFLPQAVCGIFIGALIDRYNKKKILIYSDLFISAIGLVLFFVGTLGDIPIWIIMVVLVIRSIGTAFYMPALNAVMPLIVNREDLTRFAGYAQGFKSISMLLSPAIAAALFSVFDLNIIVLLDTVGALVAVVFLTFATIPLVTRHYESENKNLVQEVKAGFLALHSKKGLTELLVISALYAIIYFPIGTLFPHITMTYFGGGVEQSGTIEVIYATGMLLGSLLLGVIGKSIDKMRIISGSIALYGISILSVGLLPPDGLPIFYGIALFIGLSNPFFMGIQIAIYQTKIEEKFLGRVLSLNSSVSMLAMPMGLIMSGLFADKIGVNRWYFLSGIVTLIIAIASRCIPALRHCCDN